MKRTLILALTLLIFLPRAALGEEKKGTLTGDYLYYNYENKQLIASGHTKAEYKDMKIAADQMILYQQEDLLIAEGNVEVDDEGNKYTADRFIYDFKKEVGLIYPFKAEVEDESLKAPVFLRGDGMEFNEKKYLLDRGSITSCDRSFPHYRLQAARVEYYPGDRIVLHSIIYFEGIIPLCYWPYFVINLDDKESRFKTPEIGQDEAGWYIKLIYMYYLNAKNFGEARIKFHEVKGLGGEVEHTYKINDKLLTRWLLAQDYYEVWKVRAEFEGRPFWPGWEGKFSLEDSYNPYGYYYNEQQSLKFNLKGGVGQSSGYFENNTNWRDGEFYNVLWRSNWQNGRLGLFTINWGLSLIREDAANRDYYDYNWSTQRKWADGKGMFGWQEKHAHELILGDTGKKTTDSDSVGANLRFSQITLDWNDFNSNTYSSEDNFLDRDNRRFLLSGRWNTYNMLTVSESHNFEESAVVNTYNNKDYYKYLDSYQPEIFYSRSNLNLSWLGTYTIAFGHTHYLEEKLEYEVEHGTPGPEDWKYNDLLSYFANMKRQKAVLKAGSFTFSWEPEWQGRYYYDKLYQKDADHIYENQWNWWWKNNYGIGWQVFPGLETGVSVYTKHGLGQMPLFTEQLKEGPRATWHLNYEFSGMLFNTGTGYDWRKKQYEPWTFRLTNKEKRNFEFSLDATYIIELDPLRYLDLKTHWQSASLFWKWNHERWSTMVGARYSGMRQALESVEFTADWKLTGKWRVKYDLYKSFQDLSTNERNSLSLTYTWHCRDFELGYNFKDDLFIMSMRIIAF